MKIQTIEIQKFGGPEALIAVLLPAAKLGSGEIRVRIKAIGLNRADILMRNGLYHGTQLPAVPGFEAAGEVVESQGKIPPGTPVLIYQSRNGLYREEAVVREADVITLPRGISWVQAAALPVNWLSAHYCLHRIIGLRPNETLLLPAAASGVGLAAIQLARKAGAKVLAVASTSIKREAALEMGAQIVLDPSQGDLRNAVLQATDGKGVDAALDIVGGDTFAQLLRCLAPFGRVAAMANVTGDPSLINTRDFYPKNAFIGGFQLGALLKSGRWEPEPEMQEILQGVQAATFRPVIYREIPFLEAGKAHELLESREVIGKIVLVV